MIFRRLGRNISSHDWFAVVIDLGVLVLGIFLGLQVTNWNEERRENRELEVYLQSLATESANSQRILENHVGWQQRVLDGLKLTIEVLDGRNPTDSELEDIYNTLSAGAWPPPYPGKREVLFEMQSTGMLQRLPPGNLKSALMEILALERVSPKFYERLVSLLTARDFSSQAVTYELRAGENPDNNGIFKVSGIDWDNARADPEFRRRVVQIHTVFQTTLSTKEFYARVDGEVLRLLADMGIEPSANWLIEFMERDTPERLTGTVESERTD